MKISKYFGWKVNLGIFLVVLSALLYVANYLIFHDLHEVLFYIGIDTAFLPIEILFVVLVIENAISSREKKQMMEKLNMVIGAFFSEVGTDLLAAITKFDPDTEHIKNDLLVNPTWSEKDFKRAKKTIKEFDYTLNINGDPESVQFLMNAKKFLVDERKFLLALLENPNLLEHETFTDLLWAVFHLMEELENRVDLSKLPKSDYNHLSGDVVRIYSLLIVEWLQYMEHLLNNYPYLFSLAVRTNPFDQQAHVEITE
jgi:hypothetical protein